VGPTCHRQCRTAPRSCWPSGVAPVAQTTRGIRPSASRQPALSKAAALSVARVSPSWPPFYSPTPTAACSPVAKPVEAIVASPSVSRVAPPLSSLEPTAFAHPFLPCRSQQHRHPRRRRGLAGSSRVTHAVYPRHRAGETRRCLPH
jgi:hypothetical protein